MNKWPVMLLVIVITFLLVLSLVFLYLHRQTYEQLNQRVSQEKIRVACIGDSITFGAKLPFRRFNHYPTRLQSKLGGGYVVLNFGANGQAVSKSSDMPYWNHENFQLSSDFNPDIVLLMLGTNDSKYYNWAGRGNFLADYRELVAHYESLPSNPQIILMTPPAAFVPQGAARLDYDLEVEALLEIWDAVRELAQEEDLPLIDIHALTAEHVEFFQPDGIHPNTAGAENIAQVVYEWLSEQ